MALEHTTWLLLCWLGLVALSRRSTWPSAYGVDPTSRGRYLANHVSRVVNTFSAMECGRECDITPGCESFNYWRRESRCELSTSTRETSPQDYLGAAGVWYFTADTYSSINQRTDTCLSDPCGHNGLCEEDCHTDGFICKCSSGYVGQQCQNSALAFYGCDSKATNAVVAVESTLPLSGAPCSSPQDPFGMTAGVKIFYETAVCGACLELTGPAGTTVVTVLSDCPGCTTEDLMITVEVHEKIGGAAVAPYTVTSKPVPCSNNLYIKFKVMGPCYRDFYGLLAYHNRYPIDYVEVLVDQSWYILNRKTGTQYSNYFTLAEGAPSVEFPVDFRLHSVTNRTIYYTIDSCDDTVVYRSDVQFPSC